MKKYDLEHIIKSKLESIELTPEPMVWDQVDDFLGNSTTDKSAFLRNIIIISATTLFIGFLAYLYISSPKQSKELPKIEKGTDYNNSLNSNYVDSASIKKEINTSKSDKEITTKSSKIERPVKKVISKTQNPQIGISTKPKKHKGEKVSPPEIKPKEVSTIRNHTTTPIHSSSEKTVKKRESRTIQIITIDTIVSEEHIYR